MTAGCRPRCVTKIRIISMSASRSHVFDSALRRLSWSFARPVRVAGLHSSADIGDNFKLDWRPSRPPRLLLLLLEVTLRAAPRSVAQRARMASETIVFAVPAPLPDITGRRRRRRRTHAAVHSTVSAVTDSARAVSARRQPWCIGMFAEEPEFPTSGWAAEEWGHGGIFQGTLCRTPCC